MALETQNVLANTFQQLEQPEAVASEQSSIDAAAEIAANADFDHDDADHPLSDTDGFNLKALDQKTLLSENPTQNYGQQRTTDQTTQPPLTKPTLADLDNISKKQGAMLQQQAKNVGAQFEATSRNPYMAFKAYEFDQYATNVDRYRGYGKATFNKLGFDPLDQETEAYYNANTSNWQDFKRMSGQFGNLFGTAFVSNYKTFSEFITGKTSLDDPDAELADQFEEANRLGMSSKTGARAFMTNLALNFAYTSGIIANIAAEEAVIALASAGLTATGAGAPAAAALQIAEKARTANKLRRVYEAWKLGMGGARSVGQMFKGGYQMLKSIRHVDDARQFWTAARAGAAVFGRGAMHFVNPFEGTTETVRGIKAGTMGYRNLTNMAKVSRTFGSFYRDVRNGWFAIGESKMEGGGSYNDIVRDEIKIYMEQNGGAFPPQEELDKIYSRAQAGGELTTLINIPMIMLSNKLTLDGMFKFKGTGGLMNAAEEFGIAGAGSKFVWNLGERTFVENSLGYLKNIGKAAFSPKVYLAGATNYFKANLTEGLQELGQEVVSGAVKDYYHNTYLDPTLGGSDYAKSMVYSSIGKNVFSSQGLHTFASGFLMGGMSSVSGKVVSNTLKGGSELFMKAVTPEKYAAYVKNKQQAETIVLNSMNAIMADPEKFFSRRKESVVNQKKATQNMSEAEINNDDYAFHNAKDDLTFDHIFTALDAGSFGQVQGALNSYRKLSDKELAEAFNLEDGAKAREKLDEYIGRADQIREKYDYFKQKAPNPFDPKSFEKGSEEQIREFIAFKAFEDAKKAAIASQYGFERATERMVGLFDALQKNPAIKKSTASDYTVLQSEKSIATEIKLLQDDIATLKQGGAEEKRLAKKKQKKLDALEEYLGHLDVYEAEKEKTTVTPDGKVIAPSNKKLLNPLSKSFKKYVNALADLYDDKYVFDDNVKSAFDKIADYYKLSDDAKSYTDIVNRLVNPEELLKYAETIDKNLMEIYDDREFYLTQSIKNYVNIFEFQGLIQSLGQVGVIISPDQVDDMVKKGVMPTVFFDLFKNVLIDNKDPRYPDIIEKVETFTKLRREDGVTEETPVSSQPAQAPTPAPAAAQQQPAAPAAQPVQQGVQPIAQQPATSQQTMPAELQTLLKQAYDEFMSKNPNSNRTFQDYIETSPVAAGIKQTYEQKNKQPQPAATAPTPTATPVTPAPTAPATQPAATPAPAPVTPAATAPVSTEAKPEAKPTETKTAGIQANPEAVGANTEVVVVNDQSERPDVFEEWTDPQIVGAGMQPMLVAKHIQGIYEYGQKLDNEGAPWTIGSFRAEVDGRRIVDVFADGRRFLMYKSVGEGTGPASKGQWTPLFGFAQNGWFIKDMWKGENPKFNKYESKTFKAIHDYLNVNDEKLFSGPEAPAAGAAEVKEVAPSNIATMGPIMNPTLVITGTRRGMEDLARNNAPASVDVKDVRGRQKSFDNDGFLEDVNKDGSRVINYMVQASDAFGRPGFLQLSLFVPKDVAVNKAVLKNLFDNQISILAKKYNLDKNYINLTNTTNEDFNKMKDAIVYELENMVIQPEVTEVQLSPQTNVVEPTAQEKTAKEKAQDILNSATSLRGFPNAKLQGNSKVALDLIELLSDVDADITPGEVAQMYTARKEQLKNNIQASDFQKGDLITFTDGRKGFINKVNKNEIVLKMIDSPTGVFETQTFDNLRGKVDMIEEKKAVPVEQTEKVEVDPADKKEIETSKNTLAEFSSDPAKIKAAMEETKAQTSTSNDNNINNLLNNLGCKTK